MSLQQSAHKDDINIPFLISCSTNILTLQDVVLDSPVWRANALHLEDQIDQFEKWIEGFIKALKSYIEAVSKHNAQAAVLCKKAFFSSLDGTLIDTKIAGYVVTKFASTLQSSIAYRMKMTSDLEDLLLNPLQKVVKNDLRSYKDCRKRFEKTLDKYEAQLSRYNAWSKQKEASALREDAFQMHEARKLYIESSGDYFNKLISFKANLENILVECFSGALEAHAEEIDENTLSCNAEIRNELPGWRQWLDESKTTCDYQVERIKKRCEELQQMYMSQTRPHRSLKKYATTGEEDGQGKDTLVRAKVLDQQDEKQGYLNSRIITPSNARPSWTRKWFFLQESWFGTCTVSTVNKKKGSIILSDRIRISESTFKICTDIDRRFCFEISHPTTKCTYCLQAETEEEMQQWLSAIEHSIKNDDSENTKLTSLQQLPKAILSPKIVMSGRTNRPTQLNLPTDKHDSSLYLIASSSSPLPSPDGTKVEKSLIPACSTTTSALTLLLIKQGDNLKENRQLSDRNSTEEASNNSSSGSLSQQFNSWGMPWLTTGINALSIYSSSEDDLQKYSGVNISKLDPNNQQQQLVVWPTKLEMDVSKPSLLHYSIALELRQRELRRLFDNVPQDEIVIESFLASLYREHVSEDSENEDRDDRNISYGYSGTAFITQRRLWFYSCTLMTCVNMVIVPLSQIQSIRLEPSPSSSSMTMLIEITKQENSNQQPFIFGLWLANAESISEKLKVAVENAKKGTSLQEEGDNGMSLQVLYDTLRKMPAKSGSGSGSGRGNKSTPASHVTTSSALYASVTPLTVQAHQHHPASVTSTGTISSTVVDPTVAVEEKMVQEGGGETNNHDVMTPASFNNNQQQQEGEREDSNNHLQPVCHGTASPSIIGSPAQGALTAVYNNASAAREAAAQLQASKKKLGGLFKSPSNNDLGNNNRLSTISTTSSRRSITPPSVKMTMTKKEEWPSHIEKPKEEVKCDCKDHLDKKEAEIVLNVSAKTLFDLMFSDKKSGPEANGDGIWSKLNKEKQYGEPTLTEWKKKEDVLERIMTYIMPVSNPMVKAKETKVIETQHLLYEKDHICYVVMVMTKTPNLPYADAFIPCIKYCITYVSPTSCRLMCSMGVKWLRSILVKGMVNRPAMKGMAETVSGVLPIIKQEITREIGSIDIDGERAGSSVADVNGGDDKEAAVNAAVKHTDTSESASLADLPWWSTGRVRDAFMVMLAGASVFFTVYLIHLQRQYHTSMMALEEPHHFHSYQQQHGNETVMIVWRGVYLRDIEEQITERQATLDHVDQDVYKLFNRARMDPQQGGWDYEWMSKQHRFMAAEFGYSRERLGTVRYELLAAFRILNRVESQLLENEYLNWIADKQLQCGLNNEEENGELCKAIKKSIEQL